MASHAIGENELYLAFNQNLHIAYLDIIEKYLSYNVFLFFIFNLVLQRAKNLSHLL